MLPEIIDGVGTSVDILDSMSLVPIPPPPRPPTPPYTPSPSPRPFSPLTGRRGVPAAAASHHQHQLSGGTKSPSPTGPPVVPRPPPRTHRKGRLHVSLSESLRAAFQMCCCRNRHPHKPLFVY